MKTRINQKGFTLIELLVVITIIAILASVSVPVFGSIRTKASQNKSLQQARGIHTGLYSLYGDGSGLPDGADSNEILSEVVIEMDSEKPFFVAGCAWHGRGDTRRGGDDLHERSDPEGIALDAGENHYAINLKGDLQSSRFPLLATGFTNTPGTYIDDKAEIGGIWEGKRCVVIYNDGSGEIAELTEDYQFMKERGGTEIDMFDQNGKVEMVNPKQG